MCFSEETQIFLVVRYYRELTEAFGERGREAFVHCVRTYGFQRGSRMAQRAIRDGQKLDYATFCRYGEWQPSETVIAQNRVSQTAVLSWQPDYVYQVTRCPWQQAFAALDAPEAGRLYCSVLDEAINQGFGGEIDFHTLQTLQQADRCIFAVRSAGLAQTMDLSRIAEGIRDYAYHSAHVYVTFGHVSRGIFGEEARPVPGLVLAAFAQRYGEAMARILETYRDWDFTFN